MKRLYCGNYLKVLAQEKMNWNEMETSDMNFHLIEKITRLKLMYL
jgi:hypothetical protein